MYVFQAEERNKAGSCSMGNVRGSLPDWQGQYHLKKGTRGSLGFLKAVLFCEGGSGCLYTGWVASSQLLLCGGERPGAPLLSSPRYATGGRRGFRNLINPLGMYVASANPIYRQRSGVQARTCPDSGCRPWGRLLPGRFGLRPGLGWGSLRRPSNEYQASLPPASSYFLSAARLHSSLQCPTFFSKIKPRGLL